VTPYLIGANVLRAMSPIADFKGRDVRVLDPFKAKPEIVLV
jgi:DUF971 family protein